MYFDGGPFLAMRGPFIAAAGGLSVISATAEATGTTEITFTLSTSYAYAGVEWGVNPDYTWSSFDASQSTSHTIIIDAADGVIAGETYAWRPYVTNDSLDAPANRVYGVGGTVSTVSPLALDTQAKGAQAQPTVASPYQYTFTPNNPPTKVFVGVGYFDTTGSITGVTYGGQAMTAQGAAITTGTNIYLRVYELLNPTDTNAALIEVTVSEDFTGMGISVVSFTGGDTAATIRGSITTATGDSTSMTVTQSSATDDIILAFGINAVDSNTLTYSAGTKVGTDAAVYTQFLRTVGQRAGAASAAVTASCSLSRWLMWSMSVKS